MPVRHRKEKRNVHVRPPQTCQSQLRSRRDLVRCTWAEAEYPNIILSTSSEWSIRACDISRSNCMYSVSLFSLNRALAHWRLFISREANDLRILGSSRATADLVGASEAPCIKATLRENAVDCSDDLQEPTAAQQSRHRPHARCVPMACMCLGGRSATLLKKRSGMRVAQSLLTPPDCCGMGAAQ